MPARRGSQLFVIDASALYVLLLRISPGYGEAVRLLKGKVQLAAPHLIDVEILHTLRRDVAHKKFSPEVAQTALENFALTRISRQSLVPLHQRIWELRKNVTAYDAAYVALAEQLKAVLLTADGRLATAPNLNCQVQLVDS